MMQIEKDAVTWNDLPGFEGLYEVSNNGCVRSLTRSGANGRVIKQHPTVRGYMQVWLSKKNKITKLAVHRAVLMAFDRLPEYQEVCNHKDGNKINNNIENLEWCTREQNEWHKRNVLLNDGRGNKNNNFGYRKAKLYPSESLRNKLCSLGIPRCKHNLAELGEMLPGRINRINSELIFHEAKTYQGHFLVEYVSTVPYQTSGLGKDYERQFYRDDTEANVRATLLIYLLENGILKPERLTK